MNSLRRFGEEGKKGRTKWRKETGVCEERGGDESRFVCDCQRTR